MASICVPVRGSEYYSFVLDMLDVGYIYIYYHSRKTLVSFALVHGSECDGWWKYLGKVVDVELYVHCVYSTKYSWTEMCS